MQIFRSLQEIPSHYGPSVVTIGNFDGVHRGHLAVLSDVTARARALNAHSIAITFEPHPVRVLRPESGLRMITQPAQRLHLLAQTGIDAALILPFTQALSRLTAREFARDVLRDALGAVEVQEGENFRFGADARADVNELATLGEEFGFEARVHRPTLWRRQVVSSSAVRAAIGQGNLRAARQMLGRTFEIISSPAPGRGYGSTYTVPTINLAPYSELLPANGVYATCLKIDGEQFPAITNVGDRPTFGWDSFAVESHILNFHPITLDETTELRLQFLEWIRSEQKWPSADALKAQIALDVKRARHYFSLVKAICHPAGQVFDAMKDQNMSPPR
ncbi:MAG TPA: bifunctional riboflavin kinase/FMN adenylyltransferase [Acidobacteriaceae bacterium]|nr:bifunctional riboflavin kinase/FMN adenylyltransferase [Acidobacteriaceae bacterium]